MTPVRCVFSMDGNVTQKSPFVYIYRRGSILMIELFNNMFLPIEISKASKGGYVDISVDYISLGVCRRKDCLVLEADNILSVSQAQLSLWIGEIKHDIHLYAGVGMSVDFKAVSEQDVRSWLMRFGIYAPTGCCFSPGVYTEWGCKIGRYGEQVYVVMPNWWRLPVESERWNMFAIRVHEVSESYTRFRFTGISSGSTIVFDNIVYDRAGVHYRNSFLSMTDITKRLVLGGS